MQSKDPRYWEDYEIGMKFALGSRPFTAEKSSPSPASSDPQSFHIDADAARQSMFGGLIASGWHVTSKLMRLFVDKLHRSVGRRSACRPDPGALAEAGAAGRHARGLVECADKVPSKSRPEMGAIHEHWGATKQKGWLLTVKGINMVRTEAGMTRAVKGTRPRGRHGRRHRCRRGWPIGGWDPRSSRAVSIAARHRQSSRSSDEDYFEDPGHRRGYMPFNAERRDWLKNGGGLAGWRWRPDVRTFASTLSRPLACARSPLFSTARSRLLARPSTPSSAPCASPRRTCRWWSGSCLRASDTALVHRPEWARHPNGARGIPGVTVIAEHPARWGPS